MARRWKHSVTVYLTEAEYLLVTGKGSHLETSTCSFTKQALKTYIKHLEKHLQNADSILA
ncbi:hypothetical protein QUB75_23050 [Microcoleus sp. K1-B6]|uniref:hypothetical protein n=1 Tax=Microcoleus sp. K1-B6 TaxID=2818787 RepID=UPI002FD7F4BE